MIPSLLLNRAIDKTFSVKYPLISTESYVEVICWNRVDDKIPTNGHIIWPASREKEPSDITNSVDPDQPLHNIENSNQIIYTVINICAIDVTSVKKCRP